MAGKVTAEDVRTAAKLVTIDQAIDVITQYHKPKHGLVWENETYRVIRYLENLREEIIERSW